MVTGLRTGPRARELVAEMGRRRAEIGQAVFARVHSIGGSEEIVDPDYRDGLKLAVEAAIDHWIEASGHDQDLQLEVSGPLLAQARLAARRGVPLEVVLRRYLAGHAVIGDFLVDAAARIGVSPTVLRRFLRASAAETDRVIAVISDTYAVELESPPPPSGDQRRAELVRRLLDGELLDPAGLEYELDRIHLGIVVRGSDGAQIVSRLAADQDADCLTVTGDDGLLWAWIGRRDTFEADRFTGVLAAPHATDSRIGLGEPVAGRVGWRLTHDQARAALSVADRGTDPTVRYTDVALLASTIKDELLTTSLRKLYLDPLVDNKGNAEPLLRTLRAYFDADRSVSSAAAALGVTRNTVTNRLRTVEERIGPLGPIVATHISFALRLDELRLPGCPTSTSPLSHSAQ